MTQKENIRIIPFKAKKHRHLMPFTKGHGVSIAGWQFKIRSVQANGIMNLQCMGKILDEPAASITVPQGVETAPTKNTAQIDTTRQPLPVTPDENQGKEPVPPTASPCLCKDQGHGLLDPSQCPVHGR